MKNSENYLDKIPVRNEKINWSTDDSGIVTLEVQNRGIFNFLAQKVLKKPPVTYVHLDANGSFVWQIINGDDSIFKLGEKVYEKFGEESNPLYERLVKFFSILESYGFISWKL